MREAPLDKPPGRVCVPAAESHGFTLCRHCCRFLSDSKQKFSNASSISGSISSSESSYLQTQQIWFRASCCTFDTVEIILFLRSVGLCYCVCAGAHAHKHTHSQAREYTCPLSTSFTDNCWLHWISGPCCIVGRSNTVAELGGPQVSGGHVIGVEPPYNPVG